MGISLSMWLDKAGIQIVALLMLVGINIFDTREKRCKGKIRDINVKNLTCSFGLGFVTKSQGS